MPRFRPLVTQSDEDEDIEEEEECDPDELPDGEECPEKICISCYDNPECDPLNNARLHFRAFDQGFDGNLYASNFSNCVYDSITWGFLEVPTYKVKLWYGDYDDIITNTTLFLLNFTDVMHTCTDVVENIYFWSRF